MNLRQFLPIVAVVLAVACEDDTASHVTATDTQASAVAPIQSITLTPATAALYVGQQQRFTPRVLRSDGTVVTSPSLIWSVRAGTVSSGLYTADDIIVSARASNGVTGTARSTILAGSAPPPPAPTLTGIDVSPSSSTLAQGGVQQFAAAGRFSDGATAPQAVSWSATGGTITTTGAYTAGAIAGSFHAIAQSNEFVDTAFITILTTPPPPSEGTYTTSFALTEKPISEGGVWRHTDPTLTPVQTIGGQACGTQSGTNGLDDSNAYLTGFGANYEIEAVVYLKPNLPSDDVSREVELLLRWTDDNPLYTPGDMGPTHVRGYEININTGGAGGLGRFKGAGLTLWGAGVHNGDRFRARIEGQRIRSWWNDVLKIDYTDSDPAFRVTSGNPGIGFFIRSPATNTDFCFESVTVTALP